MTDCRFDETCPHRRAGHGAGPCAAALAGLVSLAGASAHGADSIGGSLALTSDYLVRGISRSNGEPAVQADLHVVTDAGLIAGAFMSSVQFDAADRRSAEVSGYAGWAWRAGGEWRLKAVASYYGYVHNDSGSQYNYAEFSAAAAYSDWLDLNVEYSPDAPRYIYYRGLTGVTQQSAEAVVHTPWRHRLAASAGVGHAHFGGPGGGGYDYWSASVLLDLAPVTVSVGYVNTGAVAGELFYGEAARSRWVATVIWRF